jgi:hypothetical protein
MKNSSTIFVGIACYRDAECGPTLRDLFAKAAYPQRISVGIAYQYMPGIDPAEVLVPEWRSQSRVEVFDCRESQGVCWARHQAQKLWRGERYYFQIDSHMRFIPEWDRILIEELGRCRNDRAVLSTLCRGYDPAHDQVAPSPPLIMVPKGFDAGNLPYFEGIGLKGRTLIAPHPTAFVCAHFLFCSAEIINSLPYDPHLYFYGEEISLACRLWTSGWDIFAPSLGIAFHGYAIQNRHWNDHQDGSARNKKAYARVRHLLGMETCEDPSCLIDLERYRLGTARSLEEYQTYSGINFKRQQIERWWKFAM